MNDDNHNITFRVKNFRSLEDISVEIKPLTFLFGPNGSGKSTFIKALRFLNHNLYNLYDELYHHDLKPETQKYVIDDEIDLMSFKEIVRNNDLSKTISFEITIRNVTIDYSPLKEILDDTYLDERLSDFIREYKNPLNCELIDVKVIFELSFDNLQNEKISISINDLKNELLYNFIPNSRRDDENEHLLDCSISIPENQQFTKIKESIIRNYNFLPFISSQNKPEGIKSQTEFLIAQIKELSENQENFNGGESEIFYQTIHLIYKIYYAIPEIVKKHFLNVIHLPPLREKPKQFYFLKGGMFSKDDYYGIPSLFYHKLDGLYEKYNWGRSGGNLDRESNENVSEPFISLSGNESYSEIINKILKRLGLAEEIILKEDTEKLVGWLSYESFDGKSHTNLAEASSGLLQILPIISIIIKEEYFGDIIVIEQPELHLHPKLQANLAELFASNFITGNNIIIETHSEHMIRKVQVLIAKGDIEKDGVAVYYFNKDEKTGITSIKEMELEYNGFFKEPWPDGFFDDSYNLARELIYARKN